jgi:hypothetical protein
MYEALCQTSTLCLRLPPSPACAQSSARETRRGQSAAILGGCNNKVHAPCSAILGGRNNTISAGYGDAFIVGSNIIVGAGTGSPNTLHVNCLNAVNTPLSYSGSFAPGTIFAASTPPSSSLALPLYIKL